MNLIPFILVLLLILVILSYFAYLIAWLLSKDDELLQIIVNLFVLAKNYWLVCFIKKNLLISLFLLILFSLLFILKQYTHFDTLWDTLTGAIASVYASIVIIDGYKEYQLKDVKIVILTKFKSELDNLLNNFLSLIINTINKELMEPENSEVSKYGWKIINKASDIRFYIEKLDYKKLLSIEELIFYLKIFKDLGIFINIRNNDFDKIINDTLNAKNLISSKILTYFQDERLVRDFTELELIFTQIEQKRLKDEIVIENFLFQCIEFLYVILNCYKSLLPYKDKIEYYIDERNDRFKRYNKELLSK